MLARDLKLVVDLRSPVPAYRQVADQVRHWLVSGALRPGDMLPGVRRLAIDLGVHHNTVAEAYRTLADEGWLDVSQGKSVRVLERVLSGPPRRAEQRELCASYGRRLRHLVAEMRSRGLPEDWIAAELSAVSAAGRKQGVKA